MSSTERTGSQSKLLEEMKSRAETLWQQLIYAKSDAEKEKLRAEYQKAFKTYQTQCLIEEDTTEEPSAESGPRRARDKDEPSPFDFNDYHEFLLAWFRHNKDKAEGSLQGFTGKTGLTAEYFIRVMKRTKRLDPDSHEKVLEYLDLPATETAFLDALYHVSETDSKAMRLAAMKRLSSFAQFQKSNPKEYETWRYLSHWYYVAIREMATLPNFIPDAEWIQKRLRKPVQTADIKKALTFLEGAGFIKRRDEDGRVESLAKNVKCAGGIFRLALGQFHREMLEIASDSIETVSSEERLLLGHTFAVPKEKYDQVVRILSEALEKIKDLVCAGENATDQIVHVELAAFPLTKK